MRSSSSPVVVAILIWVGVGVGVAGSAHARGPTPGYHPWAPPPPGQPRVLDMSRPEPGWVDRDDAEPADFHALDETAERAEPNGPRDVATPGTLPDGWVQAGNVVLPAPVANGDAVVDPDITHAIEDWPGNEYPRKHTLYLNFLGAEMNVGADNSAENYSIIARAGPYPAYTGGEQKAQAIAQAVEADVAPFGIRVAYLERPPKIVPYTMEMIGGSWQDVNTDSPAGGVAPGADCGALGQRHVVYTFAAGSTSTTLAANTASQEAGHAWGLDHTLNCESPMSYCGSGDKAFSSSCDDLCEDACQGPNTAGCRLTHDEYCGAGNDRQNEAAELSFLFGGPEPDVEPPTAVIVSPETEITLPELSDVDLVAEIGDDYGGYGWRWTISRDEELIFDEVDYERTIDDQYRPALKLTNLDAGVWRFTITVQDQYEHVASDTVIIAVGDVELPPDSGTSGPLMFETGSSSSGSETGQPLDDPDPPEDCACRSGRAAPAPIGVGSLWLSILTLGAARRRARTRREVV